MNDYPTTGARLVIQPKVPKLRGRGPLADLSKIRRSNWRTFVSDDKLKFAA